MTPETKRKFNLSIGSLFLVSGIISAIFAYYVSATPAEPIPAPTSTVAKADLGSCRSALIQMGFNANIAGGVLTVNAQDLNDAEGMLVKATAAVNMCGLEMKEFCMGEGCEKGMLFFDLVEPKGSEPKANAKTGAKDAAIKPGSK